MEQDVGEGVDGAEAGLEVVEVVVKARRDAEPADELAEGHEPGGGGEGVVVGLDVDGVGVGAVPGVEEAFVAVGALATERVTTHLLGALREGRVFHRKNSRCSRRALRASRPILPTLAVTPRLKRDQTET